MNQSDPNKTIYSITYKYLPPKTDDDDDDIQPIIVHQPVYWNPQSKNAAVPPAPSQTGNGLQSNVTIPPSPREKYIMISSLYTFRL